MTEDEAWEEVDMEVADETMHMVSFRCTPELMDWLADEAAERDTSLSAVIRDCIALQRLRTDPTYTVTVNAAGTPVEIARELARLSRQASI